MGWKIKVPKIKAPTIKLDNKSLGNWVKNVSGNYLGYGYLMPKKDKGPGDPGESPELTALRERLTKESDDYRNSLSGMQGEASDEIMRGSRSSLESGTKGIRRSMNQRGLLYSGIREGEESGLRSNVASTTAKQIAQSNKDLANMSSSKDLVAATVGLDSFRDATARADAIASQNMQNQIARTQAMQQLGQAGGYAAGALGGSSRPTTGSVSSGQITDSRNSTMANPYSSIAKATVQNNPEILKQGYRVFG